MTRFKFETKLKKDLGLKYRPDRFIKRESAFNWANNATNPRFVMLGCDGRFWVVCGADASRLSKQGYEFAA